MSIDGIDPAVSIEGKEHLLGSIGIDRIHVADIEVVVTGLHDFLQRERHGNFRPFGNFDFRAFDFLHRDTESIDLVGISPGDHSAMKNSIFQAFSRNGHIAFSE